MTMASLIIESVPICADCIGDRWTVKERDQLIKLIATIAMGQAVHAAKVIRELQPAEPKLKNEELKKAAIKQLAVGAGEPVQAIWRRDGFLFEAVSWIAAHQQSTTRMFLKDPHLKSTTQGIDGLMIELEPKKDEILRTTVFEDKCSEDPEKIFSAKVLPGFEVHHSNERAPELVSIGASLLEKSGMNSDAAVIAAERILNLDYRRYRASLAVTSTDDSEARRKKVFKNYDKLGGIKQDQRLGASFVITGDLRVYFESLAQAVIKYIQSL